MVSAYGLSEMMKAGGIRYLQLEFSGLDNWVQGYVIKFVIHLYITEGHHCRNTYFSKDLLSFRVSSSTSIYLFSHKFETFYLTWFHSNAKKYKLVIENSFKQELNSISAYSH